jgi:hypothetical protein
MQQSQLTKHSFEDLIFGEKPLLCQLKRQSKIFVVTAVYATAGTELINPALMF